MMAGSTGDGGEDRVAATLTVRAGSTGDVGRVTLEVASVEGGSGSDTLVFKILDDSDGQASINAKIIGHHPDDLGSAFDPDTAIHTSK